MATFNVVPSSPKSVKSDKIEIRERDLIEIQKKFKTFTNKIDHNNAILSMHDINRLLYDLSSIYTETEAKTMINELETIGDGSGWILNFDAYIAFFLFPRSRSKVRNTTNTIQWEYLKQTGLLLSTEYNENDNENDAIKNLFIKKNNGENMKYCKEIILSSVNSRSIESSDHSEFDTETRYDFTSFPKSFKNNIKYPNNQIEYGIEFPTKKKSEITSRTSTVTDIMSKVRCSCFFNWNHE